MKLKLKKLTERDRYLYRNHIQPADMVNLLVLLKNDKTGGSARRSLIKSTKNWLKRHSPCQVPEIRLITVVQDTHS